MMFESLPLDSRVGGASAPRRVVVLVHGYGANAEDLMGLVSVLAPLLPDTAFIAPNAPQPCDAEPVAGRQWFPISAVEVDSLQAGVRGVAGLFREYLHGVLETSGLGPESMVLLGFSQGSMLSLYVGLQESGLAGVLSYAGGILPEWSLPKRPAPVLMVHGGADAVVPCAMGRASFEALRGLGYAVEFCERPGLDHGIDEGGLLRGAQFLRGCFGL